jgi:UDPglucose 6-dehydrogenase
VKVSIVGLGKLGAPMAAVYAAKGHEVVGVDTRPESVELVNQGKPPVSELGLPELLEAAWRAGRLRATIDVSEAVSATDLTHVIVPTPSEESGAFSNRFVLEVMAGIGQALAHKPGYHVVNITSTVMPGSTGGPIRAALEAASGRTVGHGLGLCYSPEFVALGSVIENMLRPDTLLIGESDERAGSLLAEAAISVTENQPAVHRMSLVNAEIAKIAVNTFVTTKISYANMLADICDRLEGADVEVVAGAVGADSRIGRKYLRGAIGYGGPCFPRDNVAFGVLAESVGADPAIAVATHAINRRQVELMASRIARHVPSAQRVAILGLAYKADTAVVEESQGVMLAEHLVRQGVAVVVYDPEANASASKVLDDRVHVAASVAAAINGADAVVIATAWPEFADIPPAMLVREDRPVVVFDCWRILDVEVFGKVATIVHPGRWSAP